MKTIYKYVLRTPLSEVIPVTMPFGAILLTVNWQEEELFLWAEVDTEAPACRREFFILGTGRELPANLQGIYVHTFFQGAFVWHLYEVTELSAVAVPSPRAPAPSGHYKLVSESFEAFQLTEDNLEFLAFWCGGSVRGKSRPPSLRSVQYYQWGTGYIACIGEWLVKDPQGCLIQYPNGVFQKVFKPC